MLHLNTEQLRAVRHVDGPMLVLAGPGSGKTAVLTQRIYYLISSAHVKPDSILVLTFSNKAAREMQHRFNSLAGTLPVIFGTFHSVFFHVLKQYRNYNNDSIISNSQKIAYIRDIANKMGYKTDIDLRWCNETLARISAFKNTGKMPGYILDDEKNRFLELFDEYCRRLKAAGLIDFDDMISFCLQMLRNNQGILLELQRRYRYILVDEFQDCNTYQYELLKLLSKESNNLFAVGDDDQSIYGFRGSDSGIVLRFLEDYPDCGYVELIRNYRCSKNIIDKAYELIGHNRNRKVKTKQLPSIFRDDGEVRIIKTEDAYSEAEEVYKIIENVHDLGVDLSDISILYRTDTASDYLLEYLSSKKIKSNKTVLGGLKNKEYVKDILSYLRISQGLSDNSDYLRILNKPDRGLVRECVGMDYASKETMMSYYNDDSFLRQEIADLFHDMEYVSQMPPYAAITYIWKKVGYGRFIGSESIPGELLDFSKGYKSIRGLIDALRSDDSKNKRNDNSSDDDNRVILQTIHASKGLEYDTVIIIGLQEGLMPHNLARTEEEIEEERRLMYVAMTRAKNRLYLIARGKESHGKKYSRFINELNMDL